MLNPGPSALKILKIPGVALARISQFREISIALFLLASITPLFYFVATRYFLEVSPPPYSIFATLFLVMAPLGIFYLALKNTILGAVIAVLSVPIFELLWVLALWGNRWMQSVEGDQYLAAIGVQCASLALAGVLFIFRKLAPPEKKAVENEDEEEDDEDTNQNLWFVTLQRGYLILTALALIVTLIIGDWGLKDRIYLGLGLGVILFSWIDSLISGVTLIVGVPVGLYLLYLKSPPWIIDQSWWTANSFIVLLSICIFVGGILSVTWDWISWNQEETDDSSGDEEDEESLPDEEA